MIIENRKLLFSKIINQWYEHNFACLSEKENAETNLQWTLSNSNDHRTEEIVRVEGRVLDTESYFPETSDQETEEFEQLESLDLGALD